MNFTPRYLGRGSWLARRDPRLLVLAIVCFVFSAVQVWDVRLMLVLVVIAFLYYRSAGIPFREVRGQWTFAVVFISLIVVVNGLISSGRMRGVESDVVHLYGYLPILGTPISAESLSYGATQLLRFLTFITMGFPIAYAIAPSDLGPALARLRIPEKFAVGVDLTYRFIPSLAGDLQETIDAQRVVKPASEMIVT